MVVQDLYNWLEVEFNPLSLCNKMEAKLKVTKNLIFRVPVNSCFFQCFGPGSMRILIDLLSLESQVSIFKGK